MACQRIFGPRRRFGQNGLCVIWVHESPGVQVCKAIAYVMHIFVETIVVETDIDIHEDYLSTQQTVDI